MTELVKSTQPHIFKLATQKCDQVGMEYETEWNLECLAGGGQNHELSPFPEGPYFSDDRITQILYGFYTSQQNESNCAIHLFRRGIQFSGTFGYGGIRL